jgi:hypothetical protein
VLAALETQRRSGSSTWIADACLALNEPVWVVVPNYDEQEAAVLRGVPEDYVRTIDQIIKSGFPEKRPVVIDPACLFFLR